MNEPVVIYPWLVNWKAVSEVLLGGLAGVVMLYFWVRAGRDRTSGAAMDNEAPLHDYAGIVQTGNHKVPAFLVFFMVIITLWAIGYIVNIHLQGGLNY